MSERPKLYPRCFLGWWVCEDVWGQWLCRTRPECADGEWKVGELDSIQAQKAAWCPIHDFDPLPWSESLFEIAEEMCEPDTLELLATLEAIAGINPVSPVAGRKMREIACGALAKYGKAGA